MLPLKSLSILFHSWVSFFLCFSSSSFAQGQSVSLREKLTERREASKAKVPAATKKVMNDGVNELRELGLHKKALGLGKKVPPLTLKNIQGQDVALKSFYKDSVIVLTFYRGSWCPYCMLELDAYQSMMNQFKKAGAQIVAVSPDQLKEVMKMRRKRDITFTLLSDAKNRAAKAFGLAFQVDKKTLAIYQKFGIDLDKAQGNSEGALPMPGTYVIDKTGTIRYSYVDPDYTKRAEPAEVLKVVKSLGQ